MQGDIHSQNNATMGWLTQAVSGLLLVGLLCLHMIANHFVLPGGLQTYQDVVRYLSNPLILVFEVMFLIVVTLHALLGVRSVILDTGILKKQAHALNVTLTGLGIFIVLYGLWMTFVVIR